MQTVADQSEAPTAIRTNLGAIFVSLELSRSTWLITSLSPAGGEKMSKHVVRGGDVAGLLECVSAWNKDPVFGVIGIQSGPRDKGPQWLPSSHGSRGWDAGGGDDCEDPSRLFCSMVSRSRRSAGSLAYRARWSARSSGRGRRSFGTSERRSHCRRWALGVTSLIGCWRRTRARQRENG